MTYIEKAIKDEHANIRGEGKQQKITYIEMSEIANTVKASAKVDPKMGKMLLTLSKIW